MSELTRTVKVHACMLVEGMSSCPFLGEACEEAQCTLAKDEPLGWNADLHKQPEWCPLRKGPVTVEET